MTSNVIATCHGVYNGTNTATPWSLMMLLFWEGGGRETLALAAKCVCCSYVHVLMCDAQAMRMGCVLEGKTKS